MRRGEGVPGSCKAGGRQRGRGRCQGEAAEAELGVLSGGTTVTMVPTPGDALGLSKGGGHRPGLRRVSARWPRSATPSGRVGLRVLAWGHSESAAPPPDPAGLCLGLLGPGHPEEAVPLELR